MRCRTSRWRLGMVLVLAMLGGCTTGEDAGKRSAEDARAGKRIVVTPDVVYGHKYGMALTFDVFQPRDRNGAAVLFINSGGFESGVLRQCEPVGFSEYRFVEKDSLFIMPAMAPGRVRIPLLGQFSFEDLLSSGFTVFDVRHGSNPKFTLDEIVADCRRAVRFIRHRATEFGVDPDRIGVWGASAGGYLAILLGASADEGVENAKDGVGRTSSRIHAVVAYYPTGFDWIPITERFPELLENLQALHIDREQLASLSIRGHISPDDPPILIVHGEEDLPFITEESESLYTGFRRRGCEAKGIVFPGTGHEFSGADGYHAHYGDRAMSETVAWFQGHIGTPRKSGVATN